MKIISFKEFKKESLKNPKIKRAYDALAYESHVLSLLIEQRIKKQMTQKQLAKRLGTKQSAISRFERGHYSPTMPFLQKVASALDSKLEIKIVRK